MKVCKDLVEFYNFNDKDLTNILVKGFKSLLNHIPLEDLKSEIYLRLHHKKYISNFRPLDIVIDEEDNTWLIKPSHAKFSTYICKFIYNYIYAYHNKVDQNDTCLSLDEYNDSGYSKNEDSKKFLTYKNSSESTGELMDFNLEVESYLEDLKKRTKNRGSFVFDNEGEEKIIKVLDMFGDTGVEENAFFSILTEGVIDGKTNNGLISTLKDQIVDVAMSLEKKGAIRTETTCGKKRLILDEPERRSLYKLFKYYIQGYKDKEISQKFKMSVAGVGAMKRILREEIKEIKN